MARTNGLSWIAGRLDARRLTVLGGILVAVAFVAGTATFLYGARIEQIEVRKRATAALSLLFAEHMRQALTSADLVLDSLAELTLDEGAATPEELRKTMATQRVHDAMVDRIRGLQQIDVLTVVDLDGKVINFTRGWPVPAIDLSDRDYVLAHKADPKLEHFLGTSVKNKGNGTWTFYLTRKLHAADGRLLGLALAGIKVEFFENFFRDARPSDFTISLLRTDSSLLARYPSADDMRGRVLGEESSSFKAFKAGETAIMTNAARATDASDVSTRIVAPRQVQGFPLFVTVIAPEHVIFAEWQAQTKLVMIIGTAVLLVVGAVTAVLSSLLRRRLDTLQALGRAEALAQTRDHELQLSRVAQDALRSDGSLKATALGFTSELTAWVDRLDSMINEFSRLAADLVVAADGAARASTSASQEAAGAAQQAMEVARVAESTSEHAGGISRSVSETVRTFGRVEDEIERSNEAIAHLAEATGQIAAVSKMISTVASQTNLLALNATIEAARAGEAGRGFAVVAGEVKSLAAQTASATSEIERQIGSIQSAGAACIEAVQGIRQRIVDTERFSRSIEQTVAEQTASAARLAETVRRSAEHSKRVQGSAAAVTDVAEVSRDISAALDELASEMKRQAHQTAQRIEAFRRDYGSAVLSTSRPDPSQAIA